MKTKRSPRVGGAGAKGFTSTNGREPNRNRPQSLAETCPFEITVFTKDGGPLTKHIALREDGSIVSDGSACVMSSGDASRYPVASFAQLATLITELRSDQAIALGTLRAELPDKVEITTKNRLDGEHSDLIARTAHDIVFEDDRPALALFDYDDKGMPPRTAQRIKAAGGFWSALVEVIPELKDAAAVIRRSTSAGLTNADTGEEVAGSNGQHGYVLARDGADIPRFLKTLHERCWLAGYGWMMVGESGQYLDRSIIDRMVGAPERLVFEGPPMVEPPLRQDPEKRRPLVRDGGALDTVSVCRPLTLVEKETLKKLKAEAKQGLTVERNRAREAHIERLAKRRKLNPNDARKIVELSVERGILLPNAPLEFDNPELNDFTVADILDDPAGFEGVTLADPIEGIEYGRCKARVMRRGDGSPWIHSFAHGRTTYELRYDASAVRARLGEARDPVQLLLVAYLDAVEEKELVHAIAQHLKVGVRAVEAKLKAARSEIAQKAARETRERRLAGRTDPRARLYAPPSDAPWLPAVTSIDEVLSSAATPPPRNARGIVARVRPRPVLGMHSFTSKTANEEETSND